MTFDQMKFGLIGEVPGLPSTLAPTKVNEALGLIYEEILWSFQLKEDGWLTPGLLFPSSGQSKGTVTTAAYSNKIIGDTVASAAWAAYVATNLPWNQLQIRSPWYSLYNILTYDTTSNAPFGTLTLDRNWMEPAGAAQAYLIYQAYFTVPVADFKRFIEIRDTTNGGAVDYWSKTRKELAFEDPQRTQFSQPMFAVPYEVDARSGSASLGQMLYELWPHPLSALPYTFSYVRRGPALSAAADTVPYPLTEELVMWRAKEISYLWREAQKGEQVLRGSGADWRFLSEAAHKEYEFRLKKVKDLDRGLVELYTAKFRRNYPNTEPYANINSGLYVGRF